MAALCTDTKKRGIERMNNSESLAFHVISGQSNLIIVLVR